MAGWLGLPRVVVLTWRLRLVVLAVCTMLGCDAPSRAVPQTESRFTRVSTEYVDNSVVSVLILKDTATGVCYAVWGYDVGGSDGVVTSLGPVPCNTGGPHAKP